MALVRTNVQSLGANGTVGTLTTSSFTPSNSSLLVAYLTIGSGTANTDAISITDTAGLTWTKRGDATTSDNFHRSAIFTAPVTTGVSMTVSGKNTTNTTGEGVLSVWYYTGHNVASPIGATGQGFQDAASSTFTVTLSANPAATSLVCGGCCADTNAGTPQLALTSGYTQIFHTNDALNIDCISQEISTTSTSFVFTAIGTDVDYAAAVIEVKIASAAAVAGPGRTPALIFRPGRGPTRGLYTQRSTFIPAAGSVASGDGASIGTGAASAVGAALFSGVGATSGVGTVAAVGQGIANSVAASAGVGAAAAVGQDIANSVAASAGIGAATGIGASTAAAVASSAGVGAAAAVGSSTTGADGVASSVGQATVAGVSAALAASAAASSGIGAAAGASASLFSGVAATSGTGTAAATGAGTADAVASSAGAGTALGVGDSQAAGAATGASAGTAIVLGIGASLANSVAAATASSIVLGVGPVTEQPAGGAGFTIGTFTRKRWRELQELIAAERAAAAKAAKVGSPARAEALEEAAGKAADAIAALEAVEERDAYTAGVARLTGLLEGATKAKKVGDSIREAKEAAVLAAKLAAEAEDEAEVMMLLE